MLTMVHDESVIAGDSHRVKVYSDASSEQDVNLEPKLIEFKKKSVIVLGDVPREQWESIFEPRFRGVVNDPKLRISTVGLIIEYKPDGVEDDFILFGVPHGEWTSLFIHHDLADKLRKCPFKDKVQEYFQAPQ